MIIWLIDEIICCLVDKFQCFDVIFWALSMHTVFSAVSLFLEKIKFIVKGNLQHRKSPNQSIKTFEWARCLQWHASTFESNSKWLNVKWGVRRVVTYWEIVISRTSIQWNDWKMFYYKKERKFTKRDLFTEIHSKSTEKNIFSEHWDYVSSAFIAINSATS